ncbi:MAG TPA: VWA domain-containing protein [Bryobacteraceae bacterium]|jgi:VWFA-related protein
MLLRNSKTPAQPRNPQTQSRQLWSGLLAGVLAVGLFFLAHGSLPAQQAPANADDDVPIFKSGTELVDLHVSVMDKNGKLITDVPEAAFKVTENGVEQPIKNFRREDVPVSMGILIDNSGSMRDKRTKVAAAAKALILASNPQDEDFIVNFNDDAFLDQPFTSDVKKLSSVLDKLGASGGTAMRDAIRMSINYMKQKGTREKKVLLVVTDGNDNTSEILQDQLMREVRESDVLIYAIGLLSEEEPRDASAAKKALKALTEASGGLDYYPKDLSEVEKITPQVAHEIRNQYLLAYSPTNTALDGTFRQIRVTVKGYTNVRYRNGYYATAAGQSKPTGPSFSNKE